MSDAVDNAEVMLYAVSEKYKESGNCRLEANYAHQQGVDMIPLMAQKGYQAKGWLGLILSTRLWYPFFGCEDEDDAKFEKRVEPVVGVIGETDGHVSLRGALDVLWARGVRRVLLECGPTLLRSFGDHGFVDQYRVYTGNVNGGRGPSLAGWLDPHRLRERQDRECGEDVVLEAFAPPR